MLSCHFLFRMTLLRLSSLTLFFLFFASTSSFAQINWLTWEQAIAKHRQQPKKILVDVYTDWCGWCKRMDKSVFADPKVSAYISKNFYAVKLDAEQRAKIVYDGHTFNYKPDYGRRGAHELAVALLDGRMSYPSLVYLDESRSRISISPGFKPADRFIHELAFIQDEHYRNKTYQEYLNGIGKK